jgi:hypothetical protein
MRDKKDLLKTVQSRLHKDRDEIMDRKPSKLRDDINGSSTNIGQNIFGKSLQQRGFCKRQSLNWTFLFWLLRDLSTFLILFTCGFLVFLYTSYVNSVAMNNRLLTLERQTDFHFREIERRFKRVRSKTTCTF